jgi:predicted DNA-binding protein
MATQMMVRIDPELKSRFNKLARAEGKTTSQMVRELRGD